MSRLKLRPTKITGLSIRIGQWINIGAQNFHPRCGLAELAEAAWAVEAVSVAGGQAEAAQALQCWMRHHAFH